MQQIFLVCVEEKNWHLHCEYVYNQFQITTALTKIRDSLLREKSLKKYFFLPLIFFKK